MSGISNSVCISRYVSSARTYALSKLLLHFLSKLLHLPKVDTFEGWQKGILMSWAALGCQTLSEYLQLPSGFLLPSQGM